jgi:hypothetical protein
VVYRRGYDEEVNVNCLFHFAGDEPAVHAAIASPGHRAEARETPDVRPCEDRSALGETARRLPTLESRRRGDGVLFPIMQRAYMHPDVPRAAGR